MDMSTRNTRPPGGWLPIGATHAGPSAWPSILIDDRQLVIFLHLCPARRPRVELQGTVGAAKGNGRPKRLHLRNHLDHTERPAQEHNVDRKTHEGSVDGRAGLEQEPRAL